MTSLSAFPAGTSPTLSPLSSSAAEALLSRARRLSSKANKKTQPPTSFAEGEDPTALSAPYSSATSSNSHLHQLHRNSFNSYIREQNKKRSSHQHQRLSSTSTVKSTDESPSSPESPCPLKPLSGSTPSEHEHTPSAVVVVSPGEDDKQDICQPKEDQPQQQTEQQTQTEQQAGVAITAASADPLDNNSSSNGSSNENNSGSTESSTSTCSLTAVTRPRALTLDSAQKTESTAATSCTPSTTTTTFSSTTVAFESVVIADTDTSTSTSNLAMPVDKHRRHQSENGTHFGLVHGILEALRDSEPESKALSSSGQEERKDSGVIMIPTLTATSTQSLTQGHLTETRNDTPSAGAPSTLLMSSENGSSEMHGSSPSLDAAIIAPSPNLLLRDESVMDKEQPPLPVQLHQEESAPVPAPKTAASKAPQGLSIITSTAIIPTRSDSAIESCAPTAKAPADTPNNTPAATSASSNSLLSPMTPSKKSRRSSNLLGKLVPKFLQTSFAAGSGGGSGSSPRSAHPSTSLSSSSSKASAPVMTRPTRSSTFSGSGSTSEVARKSTLPAVPMIPPLILETNEMEIRSPDATSPTAVTEPEAYLECLRSTSETPTPSHSARRSSCSSDVSKRSNLSMMYSMSSVDPTESYSRIEGIVEEKTEDSVHNEKQQPKEQEREREPEPEHSPYTIDENCDDDFFLNSVLRRSRSAHQQQQPQLQQQPHLSSISTTWMSSTPALSGTGSQSSSVTGSPISPVASPSILSSSPHSHHFRSYSTPTAGSPIVVGLDEKRSRLRDAVSEWRRATNTSSPIYTHNPSASFSN